MVNKDLQKLPPPFLFRNSNSILEISSVFIMCMNRMPYNCNDGDGEIVLFANFKIFLSNYLPYTETNVFQNGRENSSTSEIHKTIHKQKADFLLLGSV